MHLNPGVVYHRGKTRSAIYFKHTEGLEANFKEEEGKITAILFPINKNEIGEDLSFGLVLFSESTGLRRWRAETAPRAGLAPVSFPYMCTAAPT